MTTTTQLRAAMKFGPGYFIREQMELRDWTSEDLADVLGITTKHLSNILQDKQPLTLDMAKVLGQAFDTTAQYWINHDTSYRLWLDSEKSEKESEADLKATIYERMPVKDMLDKKWLKPFKNATELKKQVLAFWNWKELDFSSLDKDHSTCLPRKSEAFNQFNISYALTWLQKARTVAEEMPKKPYKKQKLESLFNDIHTYTVKDSGIKEFTSELADAGVIFFVLPHLKKTYLDGAAFYHGKNPVIVYTARHNRVDNFWFTVTHEMAHVLNHLSAERPCILDDLKKAATNKTETEANELAAEKLMHNEVTEYFGHHDHYLSATKVEECADHYQIHPSIVAGKLAHDGKISYRISSQFNNEVLSLIPRQYKFVG